MSRYALTGITLIGAMGMLGVIAVSPWWCAAGELVLAGTIAGLLRVTRGRLMDWFT